MNFRTFTSFTVPFSSNFQKKSCISGKSRKKSVKIWQKCSKILKILQIFVKKSAKFSAIFKEKNEIRERYEGVHFVDLDETFPTSIDLQNLASIQRRTSPLRFARSPRTDPPGTARSEWESTAYRLLLFAGLLFNWRLLLSAPLRARALPWRWQNLCQCEHTSSAFPSTASTATLLYASESRQPEYQQ